MFIPLPLRLQSASFRFKLAPDRTPLFHLAVLMRRVSTCIWPRSSVTASCFGVQNSFYSNSSENSKAILMTTDKAARQSHRNGCNILSVRVHLL